MTHYIVCSLNTQDIIKINNSYDIFPDVMKVVTIYACVHLSYIIEYISRKPKFHISFVLKQCTMTHISLIVLDILHF
jgi:hypothetical protein